MTVLILRDSARAACRRYGYAKEKDHNRNKSVTAFFGCQDKAHIQQVYSNKKARYPSIARLWSLILCQVFYVKAILIVLLAVVAVRSDIHLTRIDKCDKLFIFQNLADTVNAASGDIDIDIT